MFLNLIGLLGCKNPKEEESYKIYNAVLKEMVSTYGVNLHYIHFPNHYSREEIEAKLQKISDSLLRSKSLTFYLDDKKEILDTLNLMIEAAEPKISKSKIDFSKITEPKFATRLNSAQRIDENAYRPVYLGQYKLSEPVFISASKAVVKFDYHCGGLCGYGYLIYLQKIDGQWKIVREDQIYIAKITIPKIISGSPACRFYELRSAGAVRWNGLCCRISR